MGDDSGTVYVRERGQLNRVVQRFGFKGIVLAEDSFAKTTLPPSCSSHIGMKREHFIFTYNKEGSLRYTAKSLYDLSLLFVANNIHHVDSLVGFPEQVGDTLFVAAEEKQIFSDPVTAPRALQLFSDAYGEIVLGSLCLRNRFPLLNEKLEEIKRFQSLKRLDLFGCRLGDNHEIFQHLTSDTLSRSLVHLFLGGNGLSDVGLQRLTAPVRMMKRGLRNLQLLDLSYNPISERGIGYLACLPKLQSLDLSGTDVRVNKCRNVSLKKMVRDVTGLVQSEKPLEVFDHSRCKTEGWAEQVINQWESSATEVVKQEPVQESRTAAIRFFGRQKFVRDVLRASPLVWSEEDTNTTPCLHFHKQATSVTPKPSPQDGHETPLAGVTPKPSPQDRHETPLAGSTDGRTEPSSQKRQREPERGGDRAPSPPAKRFSSSALSQEDQDLLDSY